MGISRKFLALAAAVCALAIAPVAALGAGLKVTATPTHPKAGKTVELKVTGLKAREKVKATEVIADGGQKRTLYPRQRASASGVIIVAVKAQVKGKHTWRFEGRTSHRSGKTFYVVK
jgi:mRNA degradation ribonuclease J1/J2